MPKLTCIAPACDGTSQRGKLRMCEAHHAAAASASALNLVRAALTGDRNCIQCGCPLPAAAKINRDFCSTRCANVRRWVTRDAEELKLRHQAWRDASKATRLERRLEAMPVRFCSECGVELTKTRKDKRYCSRACINQVSLRTKRLERRNSHHKYRSNYNGPGISPAAWLRMCKRFGHRCAYCGRTGMPLTKDHVVPISRGGWHAEGNIVPACLSCNCSKGARLLREWRQRKPAFAP